MKNIHHHFIKAIYIPLFLLTSCTKLVEIPESKSQIESEVVFSDSAVATSALFGIYSTLGTASSSVHSNIKYFGLYSDEYIYTSTETRILDFSQSRILTDNTINEGLWTTLYSSIYQCNALLTGLDQSSGVSLSARKRLQAEAKFLRAYSYFYLVNCYDNVPLVLTTDINSNSRVFQSPQDLVYEQILKDLNEARSELTVSYSGNGRVRANSLAASSLLARVLLYQAKWAMSAAIATEVINSGQYFPLPKLEDVFAANSKETILQFWSTNGFVSDATASIPVSATVVPQYTLTENLYQAFEDTDNRKSKWTSRNNVITGGSSKSYYYLSKYKNRVVNTTRPEFVMALRVAEQYLIRAEALAQQGNVSDAVNDLNVIRERAGLVSLAKTITKETCLEAIIKERRVELAGEGGHRFFDLKRTGKLDATLIPIKTTWNPNSGKAFPIPKLELTYNSNLIQNEGY